MDKAEIERRVRALDEKRGLGMSEAAISVAVEYFNIDADALANLPPCDEEQNENPRSGMVPR